jgi:hypothetical protein
LRTNRAAAPPGYEEYWRREPDLYARYDTARGTRVRDALRHDVPTAAALTVLFALLSTVGVSLLILLGIAATMGIVWASAEASAGFAEQTALLEAAGLRARRDRGLKAVYWSLLAVEWIAFLAALCFLARVGVEVAEAVAAA